MATRPRTFQQARSTYRTNPELAWWVFMRISGMLLIFLAFAHVFFNNILIDAATIDYEYVAERLSQPAVKVFDTFLLGLAMLHGTNGLRYSVEDYVRRPGRRFWTKTILYTLAAIIFVLGVMTLWAFSYDEMGAAVQALD
ncbi:MAG: succinate dehydrogenase, hydrophobic membrane anchor protein [Trueperaceae bacterium]|nr:succinate dehydrogenase, hydrophobic membrane anchor protein [Trueperaceae bacterium]